MNPAYHTSSIVKQQKKLNSLNDFAKQHHVALTRQQNMEQALRVNKIQHDLWKEKLNEVVKGYKQSDLEERVVKYMKFMDLNNIS